MLARTLPRPFSGSLLFKRNEITFLAARPERLKKTERLTGVPTNYGWVVVKYAFVAKDWTTNQLNKAIENALGERAKTADKYEIQKIAEQWEASVDKSEIPTKKKMTLTEKRSEANKQLYHDQLKSDLLSPGLLLSSSLLSLSLLSLLPLLSLLTLLSLAPTTPTPNIRNNILKGEMVHLTALHAWNYFVAKKYPEFKHLLKREARAAVGLMWRRMSDGEKNFYRDEYAELLQGGKDILRGEIVDIEVKLKATEKFFKAKQNHRLRKQKKAEEEFIQKNSHRDVELNTWV